MEKIKKQLNLTNADIARMFGYKDVNSYNNSSRKKYIERGIIALFRLMIQKNI